MADPFKRNKNILLTALAGIVFLSFNLAPFLSDSASPVNSIEYLVSPFPTRGKTEPAANTPTVTSTLISGVLSCDAVALGVICTNYGTYLDYNINIVVTGLTGGATAFENFIGTFKRNTIGGYLGMMSDFIHSETSWYIENTVFSMVRIRPTGFSHVDYGSFTSGAGNNVSVHNQTSEWQIVNGGNNFPDWLYVRGDMNWPITGYSIVGHIYIYSNPALITVTPTATKTFTPSPTVTPTFTATVTPTTQVRWYTGNSQPSVYGIKANISSPSQKPYFEDLLESGESSYVTLAGTYWIQTGWRYYEGWLFPWIYVEGFNPIDGYYVDDLYIHNWGQTKEYKITWSNGTVWCAWIDGSSELCYGIQTAPAYVHAHSEVHVSPQNGLDTYFSDVYFLDANSQWVLFNQPLWREDSPYAVDKIQNSEYRNYGP